jgi:hypothetical protein
MKTLRQLENKLSEKQKRATESLLMVFAATPAQIDESLRIASKHVNSFVTSHRHVEQVRNGVAATTGIKYRLRTRRMDEGFTVEVHHLSEGVFITDAITHVMESVKEATNEAVKWADEHDIKLRISYRPRIYYEGERKYDMDIKMISAEREAVVGKVRLVLAQASKPNANAYDLMQPLAPALDRFQSLLVEFRLWWNSDGKWIGRKRKASKPKAAPEIQSSVS